MFPCTPAGFPAGTNVLRTTGASTGGGASTGPDAVGIVGAADRGCGRGRRRGTGRRGVLLIFFEDFFDWDMVILLGEWT